MYTFPDADSAGRRRRRLATTRHDPILITTSSWMPIPVCSPMATESTSPALDASGSSSRRQAPLKNITQPDAPALHCCHSRTICRHDSSAPPVSVHAQVPADEIILNFDSLSLEEGYDFLRVSHVNSSKRCSAVASVSLLCSARPCRCPDLADLPRHFRCWQVGVPAQRLQNRAKRGAERHDGPYQLRYRPQTAAGCKWAKAVWPSDASFRAGVLEYPVPAGLYIKFTSDSRVVDLQGFNAAYYVTRVTDGTALSASQV